LIGEHLLIYTKVHPFYYFFPSFMC